MQAMDLFDMSNGYSSLEEGVQRVICPVLVNYHTCTHARTHTHTPKTLLRSKLKRSGSTCFWFHFDPRYPMYEPLH